MKAMYGIKRGMTRIFNEQGENVPVTVLELTPNVVHQVKTKERDGYRAVQIGLGSQKPQRVNRPLTGHLAQAKKGLPRFLKEVRLDRPGLEDDTEYEVGQEIYCKDMFSVGSKVDVAGKSIGKGFAGVMKRYGMKGAQTKTHGTHEYFRHGGSIGCRKSPGRVFKKRHMPGQMGHGRVLQEGLEVVAVREEDNVLVVKGSVPGPKNGCVFVRQSLKH